MFIVNPLLIKKDSDCTIFIPSLYHILGLPYLIENALEANRGLLLVY